MAMSQQQTPSQEPTQTQATPQTENPSVDTVGNAQRSSEAGLGGGGVAPQDMGIAGPFACTILGAMPIAAGLRMAKAAIESPHVQEWVLQQSLFDVAQDAAQGLMSLLPGLWPVGVGLDYEGQVAGHLVGGVDMMGSAKLIHSAANQMSLMVERKGSIDVSAAAGVAVMDAFGDESGLMAKAGISLGIKDKAQASMALDIGPLISAIQKVDPQFLLDLMMGRGSPNGLLDFAPNVEHFLRAIGDCSSALAWQYDPVLVLGAKEEAFVGTDQEMAIMAEQFSDDLPMLTEALLAIPLLKACAGVEVELRPAGVGKVDAKIIASQGSELAAVFKDPELVKAVDGTVLEWFTTGLGAAMGFELNIGVTLPIGSASPVYDIAGATVTMISETDAGGAAVKDGHTVGLMDLPRLALTMTAGGSIDDLIDAGAVPAHQRAVRVSLTAQEMQEKYPDLTSILGFCVEHGVQGESVLSLVGQATLPAEAFACLKGRGIVIPNALDGTSGILDLGQIAVALATGNIADTMPEWLQGHEVALVELAAKVQLADARLVGHFHMGAGGGVQVAAKAGLDATARGEAGVAIDKAVPAEEATVMLKAMARNAA